MPVDLNLNNWRIDCFGGWATRYRESHHKLPDFVLYIKRMNSNKSNHEILKILLASGSSPEKSTLLQELRVKFQKIARYKGIHLDDIDDVVNEGLEKVLAKLEKFHHKGTFNAWVTVLFGNHCIDYHRHQAVQRRIFEEIGRNPSAPDASASEDDFPGHSPDPAVQAEDQQRLDLISNLLGQLIADTAAVRRSAERDAEIAKLGFLELLEPREIMQALIGRFPGLTLNAVRIVLFEFRQELRGKVAELDEK